MKRIVFVFLNLFLVFTVFSVRAREMGDFVKDIQLPPLQVTLPQIQKREIAPGLFLHSLENPELPIVYGEIHIYIGKRHLGNLPTETARLLEDTWEHSGSLSYPKDKFLEEIEKQGSTFSLSIDYEKTVLSFSYLKEKEGEFLPVLESFWKEPLLDSEIMETMRNKIGEEIKRRNDNPNALGSRKSRELLFQKTILGSPSQIANLEKVTKSQIQEFLNSIQGDNRKVLLLTGDCQGSLWFQKFSEWGPRSPTKPKSEETISLNRLSDNWKKSEGKSYLIHKEVSQSFVLQLGILPEHKNADFYTLQVLNYIIGGGGFNSYYMREIRNNRGLAYSAGSGTDFQENYGVVQFYALTKIASVKEVLQLMKEYNSPNFVSKISEEELNRAKNAINNQFVFLFTDTKRILQNDLRFAEHGMPKDYLEKFTGSISRVTLSDLQRVSRTYLKPESLRTILVGPKSLAKDLGPGFVVKEPEDLFSE